LHFGIRSFTLLVAALQAVIIVIFLLSRNREQGRVSDRLLAAFLFFYAATLSEHIAGWMGWYEGQYLTFFPFGSSFIFPPLAWMYVKSITDTGYRFTKKEVRHFIPAAIYLAVHFSIWPIEPNRKLEILAVMSRYGFYYLQSAVDIAIFVLYTWLAAQHYLKYRRWLPTEFSNTGRLTLLWMRNFLWLFVLSCLLNLLFTVLGIFIDDFSYGEFYWELLIRAIIVYYLGISGYGYSQQQKIHFTEAALHAEPLPIAPAVNQPATPELEPVRQKLLHCITEQRPYLEPELTLAQLAAMLQLSPAAVSQTINTCFGKNFNDFINSYRVEAVIQSLRADEHHTQTLLGIAYNSGFNSKATFNRVFKKNTGRSPREFIEQELPGASLLTD
jgi:AraC-like DNA-binding protein